MERFFVDENSIVRQIWGKADTVLFIFAGAAAEFALNKAVDWLYFTGRLPEDPLGRLFSTVSYSSRILFSDEDGALKCIDQITNTHSGVEKSRGAQIPDWAYRDVLFLLIDYSIRSYELLERTLTEKEKAEVFRVFHRVGSRMKLSSLPDNYTDYLTMREEHLQQNLINSKFTTDLYRRYQKHLGWLRYIILKQVQLVLVPNSVRYLLPIRKFSWIMPFMHLYKFLRRIKLEKAFKMALLPNEYKAQVLKMDVAD